jgi:PAS domain S-box-containing protein
MKKTVKKRAVPASARASAKGGRSDQAKRTLAIIEEREARLRSVLETAPDAIITIDQRGIIQSFSSAAVRLFGYSPGEVIGNNVNMLMATPHRENHDGYLERYLRTGQKRIIGIGREVEARRKDGSIFPMELAVGEVKLANTHLFTGFIRDLTARTKLEQDLRQAQKMEAIGQLTGGLAHDFNNLLTVITGNLEMLQMRLKSPENLELLNEAQEAAALGAQLANRLLAFGRRQPLNPKPIDLNALAGGMVDLLRRTLGQNAVIETKFSDDSTVVMADPGQFENVLLNLAINARDAMPDGGRLTIETARTNVEKGQIAIDGLGPGRYASVSVTDTGTGMTPEVRQRAFEPFFTTKETGKGSGLGLSMVYGFVKQSGGHIQLMSELGHGTTIRIFLPVHEQAPAPNRQSAPKDPASREKSSRTILVVEDDPRVRRVSIRRLKELGYSVLEAESGPAALQILEREPKIDLLFSDVVMAGGISGIELAHEVRRRWPNLKIILTSGFAEPAAIKDGLLQTSAGWLGKPYGLKELQEKLGELLDSKSDG